MAEHTGSTGPIIRAQTMEPEVVRQIVQSLVPVAGIVGAGDLAVAQSGTPAMSVQVASGFAFLPGQNNSPVQGMYHVYNDAAKTLTIATSDVTNPRNDLVVATLRDGYYSGANNDWLLQVITGTPAGSPADPAVPNNSVSLARVRVDAGVTTILNAKITDLRPFSTPLQAPIGALAYAQVTANQGTFTATTDLTGLSVTVTVGSNRRIKITGYCGLSSSVATDVPQLFIREGSTTLGTANGALTQAGTQNTYNAEIVLVSPTAGAHTYKLSATRAVGTGNITMNASAPSPAFILVEDVGHS